VDSQITASVQPEMNVLSVTTELQSQCAPAHGADGQLLSLYRKYKRMKLGVSIAKKVELVLKMSMDGRLNSGGTDPNASPPHE
jgi:hypothetical protein